MKCVKSLAATVNKLSSSIQLSRFRSIIEPCRRYQSQRISSEILQKSKWLHIDQEVKDAIQHGKPVVALESTIIALGIPYPQNLELCETVDKILRDKGVQPATIGTFR